MATTEASARTDYRLGFTSQDEETSVERLPVTGELPPWLSGALVRVTPALLEVGGRRLAHWFDGVAMLNRFRFADGKVSYGSRFLESNAYQDAKEGEWRHGGFATDPCRSIFKRVQQVFSPDTTDNPNVNLARIGERYIAMTETPMPVEFDPETLETIGHLAYADKLKPHVTTAHPHHDVARNELVNYTVRFSRMSEYLLYGLPADSRTRRVIARMPVKEPAYMHAFGMSERYLILAEYPLRANPLKLAFSGKPFIENYSWRADEPTRFRVFDRSSGELRGTYDTDAFFCFHHVNAFERRGELVIDLCAYDDATIIDSLYLDDAGPKGTLPPVELRRYTLDLDGGAVRFEPLAEGSLELPRLLRHGKQRRGLGHLNASGCRIDLVRCAGRIEGRSGKQAFRDQQLPGVAFPGGRWITLHEGFELVDLVERVQLHKRAFRTAPEPGFFRLRNLLPEKARRGPILAADEHRCGERLQPVGGVRLRGRALEPERRRLVVAQAPVIDEADVVVILPFVRHRHDRLTQQRHGLIRAPGSAGIRLAQENCAEPVRDIEVGVEGGRDVEQRVEQLVLGRRFRTRQPVAPVVLNRADPVDVSGQRIEGERHPREGRAGWHIQ